MRDKALENNSLLEKSWIENARAWTDAVRQGRIVSRRAGTDDAILNALSRFPVGRLLDVGCGEGWLARRMAERGYQVTGIDGSELLIEQAKQGGGGRFVCLSYEQFIAEPLTLGRFELAAANFSLLSEELNGLLRAFRRALLPEGRLVIQTLHPFSIGPDEPYRSEWRVESFQSIGPEFTMPMPYFFRTVGRWVEELAAAGFQLVRVEEPVNPETGRPLSLLLEGAPPDS